MRDISKNVTALLWASLIMGMTSPWAAGACSVCYGEPDSPASKGLTWAILALAGVVGVVLSGVVMFFVHANRIGVGAVTEGNGEWNKS